MYSSDTYILFLFVILLLIVITIYNDTKYSLLVNIGTIIEAILVFPTISDSSILIKADHGIPIVYSDKKSSTVLFSDCAASTLFIYTIYIFHLTLL